MKITLAQVEKAVGIGYACRLGGNVWGVATGDYTITLNGGQQVAETPATALICRDGATVLETEINSADELPLLLATIDEE